MKIIKKYWYIFLLIFLMALYAFAIPHFKEIINNKWYEVINNLILSIISASVLYGLFQLPIVRKDIDAYFTQALLDPHFIRALNQEKIDEFSIKALVKSGCNRILAESAIKFLKKDTSIVLNKFSDKITIKNDLKIRIIDRSATLEYYGAEISIIELLEKYMTVTAVFFRHENDCVNITKFYFSLNGNKLIPLDFKYKEENTKSNISFKKKVSINWEKFKESNQNLKNLSIKKGDVINIEHQEVREFNDSEYFYSYRFPFWTKIVDIQVNNEIENINININLYGGDMKPSTYKVEGEDNRIYTNGWIYPGSGYIIAAYPRVS